MQIVGQDSVQINTLAGLLDRNAFPGAPNGQPLTQIDNNIETVQLRHVFADGMRLNASARYYDSSVHEYGSFVYPALAAPDPSTPTSYPIFPLTMRTTTHEAAFDANLSNQIDALGGHHEWLVGVGYDYTSFYSGMGFDGTAVGSLDLANPIYNLPFGAQTPINSTQTDHYRTIAAYVQDQGTYGRLHLTGSLRLTQLSFQEREEGTDKTYYHLSPRFGAAFDLVPGVSLYASYATAFRAAFGFIGAQAPKPETSSNVEAGLKFAAQGLGLSGTVAVFQQTRNNVATPDPNNPLQSIQTGQQRSRGFETDLTWEPVPALSLLASYAYTNATVTTDNVIPVGDTLPRVPRNSGRLAARYRVLDGLARGLSFGVGVTAVSQRELTLPNTVSVPGMVTVDAQAAYDFGRYTIAFSGVNLTGRRGFEPYQYVSGSFCRA